MSRKIVKYTSICFICWLTLFSGYAQQKPDADELFLKARDAAFTEQWSEARKLCRELLSYYPEYYDASILMGRIFAWELKTDSARIVISPLLEVEPDDYDVLTLLADNEIWGSQYDMALDFINQALGFYPSDEDFLFKKANVYYLKKDNTNAIRALSELLNVVPDHDNGNKLLNTILPPRLVNDESYAKANEEAKAGNWKLSRSYCQQILNQILNWDTDYFDASLLMAYTYAYESKFDSARMISTQLNNIKPDNHEVLELIVDTEIWSRKYKAALTQVEKALDVFPNDEIFLYKKANIQYLAKDYKDALQTLDELLEINSVHEDGTTLKKDILEYHQFLDYVFWEDYFEFFKEPFLSRKLITTVGLSKWTKGGTYIGKVNMGNEWPDKANGFQYELEAYKQLSTTNYLWGNYAFSNSRVFPKHRAGIEFFQRLPKGFEASAGIRFMYWQDPIWVYTGSVSWLNNRNYLAFRPFFSYINSHFIDSYNLTYRRYFSEREDYIYAMVGYGNYSDDFLQLNPDPGSSFLTQIGILKFITVRWLLTASLGYAYDDGYRSRFQALAGVRYYFNMFK